MQILEVTTNYGLVGGAENCVHQTAAGLAERGHRTAIFAGSPDESIDQDRVRVVRRPTFDAGKMIDDPVLTEAFRDFARQFKPELIHLHNTYSFPANFPRVLAEVGVPIVMTVHDWSLLCPNGWCVIPQSETQEFRVCEGGPGSKCFGRGCEANYAFDARVVLASIIRLRAVRDSVTSFVAPSAFLAEMASNHGLRPMLALPNWIDQDSFGGAKEFQQALAEEDREPHRMLFVGRLAAEKGVSFLIDAMPAILESLPDAKLSIVGEGEVAGDLMSQVTRLGLQECVEFHGRLAHGEIVRCMARASVQVLPSVWCENSPLTCYESLLTGLPMVASDIAGLPSMVQPGKTGLLVKPRDAGDLAEKLIELLGNRSLFAQLSRGCLDDVKHYSKATHLDRLEQVFAQAITLGVKGSASAESSDLHDAIHRVFLKAKQVEDWAGEMRSHIDALELDRIELKRLLAKPQGLVRRSVRFLVGRRGKKSD